jgi:hypothetical protein
LKTAKQAVFLAIFLSGLAGSASAKSWRIADFQDDIVINQNGSAVVTERISLVFVGQWNGIHRMIPIEYPGPGGTNYELFLEVQSVTDGEGSKLKYDSSITNGERDLKIYIPGAVDTTRVVEITYGVRNGTRIPQPDRCEPRPSPASTDRASATRRPRSTDQKHSSPPMPRCPCAAA